jgi:signal transduction histidine kinase
MQRLVNDLLELARLDAAPLRLNLQAVDLETLLKETTEKFAPLADKANIRLSADVRAKVKVIADYERLVQVLDNLIDNALKATPAGGSIAASADLSGDDVPISIADTGPGIPAKEAKRIFERFYQVDKSRKAGQRGTGLGLSIAQQIVQAHGGEISVESKPGHGSTFVIRLPKAA